MRKDNWTLIQGGCQTSTQFLTRWQKYIQKRVITILRDMPRTINKTDGMTNILILSPQGAYDGKVNKSEEYIDRYSDKSTGAIEFAYNTATTAVSTEMDINRGIVDLIRRLLPNNVWQTHLLEATGGNKSLKDFTIYDIIQSIQTESINTGS